MLEKKSELKLTAPAPISRIAFGVRYEPQFKVFDYSGALIDEILRADGTLFGPEVFPQTEKRQSGEHVLVDRERERALRISQQDTVLVWTLNTRNFGEVSDLAVGFDRYVLRPLRELAGVAQVGRYGLEIRVKQPAGKLKNPPTQSYVADGFSTGSITGLTLRFTRRLPAEEALLKKDVEDFRNVIYTVEEAESGEVLLSIDYQEEFRPFLDAQDWKARPFPQFADKALSYSRSELARLWQQFQGVPEVA